MSLTHHKHEPTLNRDINILKNDLFFFSGQSLVPEQTHQVEKAKS